MKKIKYAAMAVLLFFSISLWGCSSENPARAEMQAKAGINREINGTYDRGAAAVCNSRGDQS